MHMFFNLIGRLFLVALAAILLAVELSVPAHAATLDEVLTSPLAAYIAVPVAVILVALLARVLHLAAAYLAERKYNSKVVRAVELFGSIADGIASDTLAHPPAAADVIGALKNAGIAQGVTYARRVAPDLLKEIGISDPVVAARIGREVEQRLLPYLPPKVQPLAGTFFVPLATPDEPAAALAPAA